MLPPSSTQSLGASRPAWPINYSEMEAAKIPLQGSDFEMRRYGGVFPSLFTLACFAIFGAPIISTYSLTQNPSVLYWLGDTGKMVLVIPLLLSVCHILHVFSGKPRFFLVLLSTVVPAIILIFAGYAFIQDANGYSQRLFSTDCTTFQDKHNLETDWKTAYDLLLQCGNRTATATGQPLEDVLSALFLQDCDEYMVKPDDKYAKQRASWDYLRALEESDECTGWCGSGSDNGMVSLMGEVALWTNNPAKSDICSNTAATTLNAKVARTGRRIITQASTCLGVSIVGIAVIQEWMNKHNLDW